MFFLSFVMGFALAADAFAVSISLGMRNTSHRLSLALQAGLVFGFFQGLMLFLGAQIGCFILPYIEHWYHYLAGGIFFLLGVKMFKEAFSCKEEEKVKISWKMFFVLGIATSIDALAAGFSVMKISNSLSFTLVCVVFITFLCSFIGVLMGTKASCLFGKYAEILGGVLLCGLGVSALLF